MGEYTGGIPVCDNWTSPSELTYEQDLQASRVYKKSAKHHSFSSFTSSVAHSATLSVFSSLSLSQVSYISFYALPVYATDLSNSDQYMFGEQGAARVVKLVYKDTSPTYRLRRYGSRSQFSEPVSIENLRLKGRLARKYPGGRIEPKTSDSEVATAVLRSHSETG
ncbi:uncharacterized protein BDZ99DRAFT_474833 [Mytilinidion resinicola]|uniref:Uncharacterized protein n=1 Tax=Mytilinidion resinicola TaxID=574789 RepID=A0A6A6YWE6_9PEZI|nr:uncharacterized protein BDZ99DRAFT_474833 [Mytilinidion resinicola]KAF2812713.1 hypothetical protein BDZ99DRAFT_474833 [Mytilinidion resinicola]